MSVNQVRKALSIGAVVCALLSSSLAVAQARTMEARQVNGPAPAVAVQKHNSPKCDAHLARLNNHAASLETDVLKFENSLHVAQTQIAQWPKTKQGLDDFKKQMIAHHQNDFKRLKAQADHIQALLMQPQLDACGDTRQRTEPKFTRLRARLTSLLLDRLPAAENKLSVIR